MAVLSQMAGVILMAFVLAVIGAAAGGQTLQAAPGSRSAKAGNKEGFTSGELEPVMRALQQLGFERKTIARIFYDDRLRKIHRVVSINAMNPDRSEFYTQFTSRYAIRLARRFQSKHWALLRQVEQTHGVPRQFLTAILLVETQFGRAALPYRALEVFTTLAVEGNPKAVDRHYDKLRARHPDIEKDWLASRLGKKAQFGFSELASMLSLFRENMAALYDVRGSYAGAIGIPQFLPSSTLRWSVDGDGDGRVDLNTLPDAVASVGNYLKQHGWTPEAPFRDKWRAVWEYNHSEHYVRAIFEVALRLQTPSSRKRLSS